MSDKVINLFGAERSASQSPAGESQRVASAKVLREMLDAVESGAIDPQCLVVVTRTADAAGTAYTHTRWTGGDEVALLALVVARRMVEDRCVGGGPR